MDWELIETRKISGKGVLRLPEDRKKNRAYILYTDIVREPKNRYLNKNWNPPKGRYASLCFLYQGCVVDTTAIEFERQVYTGVNDIAGQTLIALKCAYAGMLESFFRLSQIIILADPVLTATVQPVSTTDLIKDYENLRLSWDEIRVQCYADTAIQLKLHRLKYDTCDPEKDKDKPPPPPPPPPPKQPPGEPIIDISPPYEPGDSNSTGDDGNTEPIPLDIPPPPPPPPPGVDVVVTVVWKQIAGNQAGQQNTSVNAVRTPYYIQTNNDTYLQIRWTLAGGQPEINPVISFSSSIGTPWFEIISITDSGGYAIDLRVVP